MAPSIRLQAILISRFLLNLCEVHETGNVSQQSQMTDLRFRLPMLQASFSVGNMGADLDYSDANDVPEPDVGEVDKTADGPTPVESNGGDQDNTEDVDVGSMFLPHTTHRSLMGRTQQTCESVAPSHC